MNNLELITSIFKSIDAFKRHRTLANIKRSEQMYNDANLYDLRTYQNFDQIELSLRALQRNLYDEARRVQEEQRNASTTVGSQGNVESDS